MALQMLDQQRYAAIRSAAVQVSGQMLLAGNCCWLVAVGLMPAHGVNATLVL